MTKKMLIDSTHPEETRVAVVDGTRLEEFDFEIAARRQIKSNIYLAKVTRVEPSLQAAFVEYGGNRHGFLPFPEIHPDYYRIPVGDRPAYDDEPVERWSDTPYAPQQAYSVDDDAADERSPVEAALAEAEQSDEPPLDLAQEESGAYDGAPVESVEIELAAIGSAEVAFVTIEETVGEPDTAPTGDEFAASDPDDSSPGEDFGDSPIEAAAASDPVIAEDIVHLHASDIQADEADNAAAEMAASEAAASVDIVGGDDVEDAQRRRRTQMPRYKIQEVIKRRQIMLVQVSKEERGNKGAAVTTFLSLPGRYCVLMPNTARGGGVSRKIANPADRKRMKELISDLEVPDGMSVILRTAGVERSKAEIKRDLEYLLRLWENIRTLTLESTAPALIYEEGNLVKRAIRDLYTRDIDIIEIAGDEGYRQAKDFMRMLMPSHAKRVQPYRDPSIPLFFRYQVESQIDLIHNPVAHLKSGGYIVINQTEALVSIDVNSGRSTRERNIEETALKTNCEAADEIARQLRLRDMGGLIVIDFIDMDEPRHDAQVERRLKEAMKNDRARIQVGRISPFGLLELSRQRLHPSLIETNFHTCAHCHGTGLVRSIESAALLVLRAIEEEGIKRRSAELAVTVAGDIALYVLNQKRGMLIDIEQRYGFSVRLQADDGLIAPEYRLERLKMKPPGSELLPPPLNQTGVMAADDFDDEEEPEEADAPEIPSVTVEARPEETAESGEAKRKRRRSRRRRGRDGRPDEPQADGQQADGQPLQADDSADTDTDLSDADADHDAQADGGSDDDVAAEAPAEAEPDAEFAIAHDAAEFDGAAEADGATRRRRRGRRGGRSRPRREGDGGLDTASAAEVDVFDHRAAASDTDRSDAFFGEPASQEEVLNLAAPTEPDPVIETDAPLVATDLEPAEPAARPDPAPESEQAEAPSSGPAPSLNGAFESHESEAGSPSDLASSDPALGDQEIGGTNGSAPDHEPAPAAYPPPRAYENVNQPPEQPRRGWWKRLVE